MTRVGILFSGRGSNMEALIDASRDPGYPAEIVLAVSNRADAAGIELARGRQVSVRCVPHRGLDRAAHEALIDAALRAQGVEIVCLAGYMRLLTPWFVARWAGRMLNVHPSLLPAFPGLDTHERALAAGVKLHGCTVHLVTEAMDEGPILAQAAVPVLPGDTGAMLAERVLRQEHIVYSAALRAVIEGAARPAGAEAALRNPASGTTSLGGIGNLDYTILLCDRIAETRAFYRDVMGFSVETDQEGWVSFRVGGALLTLRRRGPWSVCDDGPSAPGSASVQLAFRVALPMVDVCHAELVAKGAPILRGPTDLPAWRHRTLFFRDPEDNIVEIYAAY